MGFTQNMKPFIDNMDNTVDKGIGKITIKENGEYNTMVQNFTRAKVDVEGSGPGPSPKPSSVEKGDIIYFGGHTWRVLKAGNNGALDDVEVTRIGFDSSKYCTLSPSVEHGNVVDFTCGAETKTGIKYAGSDLDTFCNTTFFNSLPEDVQGAIIEQEVVQDMYDTGATDENAEIVFQNPGQMTYRIRKLSTEAVSVGTRKIYSLDCKHVYDYLGYSGTKLTLTNWELNKMVFNVQGTVGAYVWLSSANSGGSNYACYVTGNDGGIGIYGYFSNTYLVCPTFHINLTSIDFSK